MNKIELIRTVTGVKVELTLLEAASLVRTLNRVRRIVDDKSDDDYEAMAEQFMLASGREDAERLFTLARHVERVAESAWVEEEKDDDKFDAADV